MAVPAPVGDLDPNIAKTEGRSAHHVPIVGGDLMWSSYKKDYPEWPLDGKSTTSLSLQKSHFSTENDRRLIEDRSIYKKDYPAKDVGKHGAITPPSPAHIMHTDHRICDRLPETAKEYVEKDGKRTFADKPPIRQANFKLGDDNFRETRTTSHRDEFPPKNLDPIDTKLQNKWQSSIPFGDADKSTADRISEFKARYLPNPLVGSQQVAPKQNMATLRGDDRQHDFHTVHRQTYQPVPGERRDPIPNKYESSIPNGDPDKEGWGMSEFQTSYIEHRNQSREAGYDPSKLQLTHFKLAADDAAPTEYGTTQRTDYIPKDTRVERSNIERNKDCIPRGDTNPARVLRAANLTNYTYYHQPMPLDPTKPSKSGDERTKSEVVFGNPEKYGNYFRTTNRSDFRVPVSNGLKDNPAHKPWDSAIPLKPYAGFQGETITHSDYQKPNQDRIVLNQEAINNLRKTSFKAPLMSKAEYGTEYRDEYFGKEHEQKSTQDVGALQRSSLPIGTLST